MQRFRIADLVWLLLVAAITVKLVAVSVQRNQLAAQSELDARRHDQETRALSQSVIATENRLKDIVIDHWITDEVDKLRLRKKTMHKPGWEGRVGEAEDAIENRIADLLQQLRSSNAISPYRTYGLNEVAELNRQRLSFFQKFAAIQNAERERAVLSASFSH